MVRTGTMLREEQRSSAVGIPCEKVTRVWILEGQLRSTVGIGTKLREELRSRRSRILGEEVGYEMAHGGWTPCGRDLRNRLHVYVQVSVFVKEIRRKDVLKYTRPAGPGGELAACLVICWLIGGRAAARWFNRRCVSGLTGGDRTTSRFPSI
uniref:Uncharacterized protein n=1 Tax=Oryza sativa subsp. japonica TaxID=39947 RepID=Q6EP13_ORYSJ|nr:hypothetical protein [Oryza sativa Japonica Group]